MMINVTEARAIVAAALRGNGVRRPTLDTIDAVIILWRHRGMPSA